MVVSEVPAIAYTLLWVASSVIDKRTVVMPATPSVEITVTPSTPPDGGGEGGGDGGGSVDPDHVHVAE